MILSLHAQARLFLLTILLGAGMGLVYDGLRIFRHAVPHKLFWIQLEDGLFWFLAVFLVFGVMLRASHGEIRFFSVFGLFGGMGLYWLTLSRLVIALSDRIIFGMKYMTGLFFCIVFTPIRLIFLPFRKPLQKIRGFCGKQRKKLLHSCKVYVRMKLYHLRFDWKIFRRIKNNRKEDVYGKEKKK